ncbi:hypothetical protein LLH03_02965 [bacterium]|nr:hypothetical protein [bacterium]
MYPLSQGDMSNLVVDMLTHQAFIAGLTHIPEMMEGEGLTFQESLLRVLVETCESEFAFAAIHTPADGTLRPFVSYPEPTPIEIPHQLDNAYLRAVVEAERHDTVRNGEDPGKQFLPGLRNALLVPYRHRGALCVVCICNRDPESYARPGLGVPFISYEVKMVQALLQLRPI